MNDFKLLAVKLTDQQTEEFSLSICVMDQATIFFSGIGYGREKVEGSDLFSALQELRSMLEEKGYRLLCNASRENIVSSRMSRSMGGGRKAYLVELGEPAKMENLVDIFEPVDLSLVVPINAQVKFTKKWFESLS